MERFTETDCSKCGVPVNVDLDPQGDLVRYDDAQRALDAEREKVAFLEKKNANLIEASNLVLKVKAEQDAQLATLQDDHARVLGLVRDFVAAWDHDGEPDAMSYETAVDKARPYLASLPAQPAQGGV